MPEGSGWPAEETGSCDGRSPRQRPRPTPCRGPWSPTCAPIALARLPGIASITASSTRAAGQVGAPRAVLDADPGTAWSPTIGDRDPTLTVRFTAPQLVAGLRPRRADWLAENAPMTVAVTRDGRRTVAVLGIDGRIALAGDGDHRLGLQFIPDAGTDITALELAGLDVAGFAPSPPGPSVGVACGGGPKLLVGGTTIPTAVIGERAAVAGAGTLVWWPVRALPVPEGHHRGQCGQVARPGAGPARGPRRRGPGRRLHGCRGHGLEVVAAADSGLTARVKSAAYDRFVVLSLKMPTRLAGRAGASALVPRTVDGYRLPSSRRPVRVARWSSILRRTVPTGSRSGPAVCSARCWRRPGPAVGASCPSTRAVPANPRVAACAPWACSRSAQCLPVCQVLSLAGPVLIASGRGRRPGDVAADHDRAPQERPHDLGSGGRSEARRHASRPRSPW